jgi:hypothetical protein
MIVNIEDLGYLCEAGRGDKAGQTANLRERETTQEKRAENSGA